MLDPHGFDLIGESIPALLKSCGIRDESDQRYFDAVRAQVSCEESQAYGDFFGPYLQDGDNYGVYAQLFNASGAAQGPEFLVNTTTTNYQGSPGIAMSASGASNHNSSTGSAKRIWLA